MSQVLFTSARAVDFDCNVSLPAKPEEMLNRADLEKFIESGHYTVLKATRILSPTVKHPYHSYA